jgi:hypothetical protein
MIVHAAGETGPASPNTIAILLEVADEAALRAHAQLVQHSHLIVESDGAHAGHAMALAVPPGARIGAFGHLPLWKGGAIATTST